MLAYEVCRLPGAGAIVLVVPLYEVVLASLEQIQNAEGNHGLNVYVVELIAIVLHLKSLLMIVEISVSLQPILGVETLQLSFPQALNRREVNPDGMNVGSRLKFDQTVALVKVDILLEVGLVREIFAVDIADDINLTRLLA